VRYLKLGFFAGSVELIALVIPAKAGVFNPDRIDFEYMR
jgi:hypothetical protein